jgi:hypothetical protein
MEWDQVILGSDTFIIVALFVLFILVPLGLWAADIYQLPQSLGESVRTTGRGVLVLWGSMFLYSTLRKGAFPEDLGLEYLLVLLVGGAIWIAIDAVLLRRERRRTTL